MQINWGALLVVAVVSISTSVVFVALLAGGIRLVAAGIIRPSQGTNSMATRTAGWGLIGLAGALVLYGLYLIVPLFH